MEISYSVSNVGFQALAKLRKLRQLQFSFENHQSLLRLKRLVVLYVEFLPHVRLLGKTCKNVRSYHTDQCLHNEIVKLQNAAKLDLEELALSGDVDPAIRCQLPELQVLNLYTASGDVARVCDRFQNLSAIIFYSVQVEVIESVLQHVGQRLSSLTVSQTHPGLVLGNLVGWCPNLKILTLECSSSDVWNVPAGCLSRLEEIHFVMFDQRFPPGFIVQVRFAII
jgi:hypothetical protein